mmetsp:Transcript_50055/g.160172  ORF Transcript_50055/g.160172 Transcript_50055/m.160172 type:complete len:108 (+) Transcript_50055:244-567(+)
MNHKTVSDPPKLWGVPWGCPPEGGEPTGGPRSRLEGRAPPRGLVAEIAHHTFGDLSNLLTVDPNDLITTAILTPKNKYVKEINAAAHELYPGEDHTLLSSDSVRASP